MCSRSSLDGSLHIKQEPHSGVAQSLENGGVGLSHLIKREMLEHGMDGDDMPDDLTDDRDFEHSGGRAPHDSLALSMESDMDDDEDDDDVAEDLSMAADAQDEALEA
jgi:hypothetical protein